MNDPFASKGFKMLTGTSAINFDPPIEGFTVTSDMVIAALTPVASKDGVQGYTYDSAIIGKTLPPGFYPISATSITLTSGEGIGWLK